MLEALSTNMEKYVTLGKYSSYNIITNIWKTCVGRLLGIWSVLTFLKKPHA